MQQEKKDRLVGLWVKELNLQENKEAKEFLSCCLSEKQLSRPLVGFYIAKGLTYNQIANKLGETQKFVEYWKKKALKDFLKI